MSPVPQPEGERDRPNNEGSEIDETDYPDVIINADSSEDDDADDDNDDGYMGYQALSMNNDNSDSDEEDTEFDSQEGNTEGQQTTNLHVPEGVIQQVRLQQVQDGTTAPPTYMQVPEAPRPDREDLLWNQPRPSDISIETGQEEKIKSAMSGFKLPTCNIPDWAKGLTDDQWQAQVVNQLKGTSPVTGNLNIDSTSDLTFTKTDSNTSDSKRKDSGIQLKSETDVSKVGFTPD